MGDVLAEALELWRLYETLEDVDPKAMVAALSFTEHMLNRAVELLVKLGAVFTSEFFRTNLNMIGELAGSQQAPQPPQAEQAKTSPSEALKEQMKLTMMQTMIPLMMSMVQQILATVTKTASGNVQLPQMNIPAAQQNTKTIKVEE